MPDTKDVPTSATRASEIQAARAKAATEVPAQLKKLLNDAAVAGVVADAAGPDYGVIEPSLPEILPLSENELLEGLTLRKNRAVLENFGIILLACAVVAGIWWGAVRFHESTANFTPFREPVSPTPTTAPANSMKPAEAVSNSPRPVSQRPVRAEPIAARVNVPTPMTNVPAESTPAPTVAAKPTPSAATTAGSKSPQPNPESTPAALEDIAETAPTPAPLVDHSRRLHKTFFPQETPQ